MLGRECSAALVLMTVMLTGRGTALHCKSASEGNRNRHASPASRAAPGDPQEGATAHERALRAACTHGQTEVVQLLLNTIVAAGAAAVSSAGAAAVSSAGADQAGSGAGAGGAGGADGGPALSPIWGLRLARSPSLTTRELHLSLVLNTALGGAATWGHKEVVELLLQVGRGVGWPSAGCGVRSEVCT